MKWPVHLKLALARAFVHKHQFGFKGGHSFAAILVTKHATVARCNVSNVVPQPTKHAEMRCLSVHLAKMGATMFVARSNRYGEPLNARPCRNCERSIRMAGIKTVVFTNEDGTFTAMKF